MLRELQRNTTGAFVFETERGGPFTADAVKSPRENHWRACQAAIRGACPHAAPAAMPWPMPATTRG
jgi:hypothetical protein